MPDVDPEVALRAFMKVDPAAIEATEKSAKADKALDAQGEKDDSEA